jgi:hypothetical protein
MRARERERPPFFENGRVGELERGSGLRKREKEEKTVVFFLDLDLFFFFFFFRLFPSRFPSTPPTILSPLRERPRRLHARAFPPSLNRFILNPILFENKNKHTSPSPRTFYKIKKTLSSNFLPAPVALEQF